MKLFALYPNIELPNLEFNHRKYCDKNNIEYNKIKLKTSGMFEIQKLYRVCEILENNIGETCWFIDNYSYFQNFEEIPDIENDIFLQKNRDGSLNISSFIVKSNKNTIQSFIAFRQNVFHEYLFQPGEVLKSIQEKFLQNTNITPLNFDHNCLKNKHIKFYFNINMFEYNFFNVNNVISLQAKNIREGVYVDAALPHGMYLAEYFCIAKLNKNKYTLSEEKFEVYNPGMDNALVTLYTKEISNCGIISEENFKRFCKKNNITLYVYRDIPIVMENKKISGTWCKPFVLLNHIKDHKNIAWIDGDITIGKHYHINFGQELTVYQDPANWYFNAGFMIFKNTEKNIALLESIAEEFRKPEKDLSSTYVGGSDQIVFNNYIKILYPEIIPQSAYKGNTHPLIPYCLSPDESQTHLTHFMGLPFYVREVLMKAFDFLGNE